MIGADVVDVFENIRNAARVAQAAGKKFKGCVILVVDENDEWAAQCSGLDIGEVREYLLKARDNAVEGGSAFVVIVPSDAPPQEGTSVPEGVTKQ